MFDVYLSTPAPSCFDDVTDPPVTPPAAPVTPPAAPIADPKLVSSDEVSKIVARELAKERQKHETTLKQALESNTLTEKDRAALQDSLETVQSQLLTEKQRAELEKQKLEEKFSGELEKEKTNAKRWETQYRDSTVARALQDAAVTNDAYDPEQIITMLRPMTKLQEVVDEKTGKGTGQFQTVVEFPDKDPTTGDPIKTARTPEDAVKRMREIGGRYANLFKSNVVSGVGANSEGSYMDVGTGKVDLARLAKDPAAFREAIKKNPNLLNAR